MNNATRTSRRIAALKWKGREYTRYMQRLDTNATLAQHLICEKSAQRGERLVLLSRKCRGSIHMEHLKSSMSQMDVNENVLKITPDGSQ